jgi:hypothetical protein
MSARDAIIEALIQPAEGDLAPEAARYFLSLKFTDAQKDRFDELSAKARAGTLTQPEREEADEFLSTETLLIVLKAKARRSLRSESHPAA